MEVRAGACTVGSRDVAAVEAAIAGPWGDSRQTTNGPPASRHPSATVALGTDAKGNLWRFGTRENTSVRIFWRFVDDFSTFRLGNGASRGRIALGTFSLGFHTTWRVNTLRIGQKADVHFYWYTINNHSLYEPFVISQQMASPRHLCHFTCIFLRIIHTKC